MSEADVVAAFSGKGGAMKASRSERKKNAPSGTTTAKKPSATMGSGVGASAGAPAATQEVRVGVTRAGKKGKTVTVVDGFDPGGPDAAADVLKKFKRVLGAGGSLASNGAMSFQGDRAATLVEMLHAMGYKRAKQTGGLGNK
jgi:translation initiation factor 1